MPNPSKSNQNPNPAHGGKDPDETVPPSNNLWVGNLASDVTDSDLMNLFGKHGTLDTVTSYASRSYAFIYYKTVEDAKAAKDALQGIVVRGNAIKIEFARPAKPCKSLWVSGVGPSVSKEKLEEEFLKFGKIVEFKFLRDRNAAFVDYSKLEDASQALKSMNGKRIGGGQIRVDFLRSQPSRREQWADVHDARDTQFLSRSMAFSDSPRMPQDLVGNYSELMHSGSKRQQQFQSLGVRKVDGQPTNVLWVGYPPSVHIDEQMLHNAMILFGEIERIKSFPSRNYSFVEFRSVDEARRAKEGLQGRLFNDPRISIMFSSSDLAPSKDFSGFNPGIKGPRPEMFLNDIPFGAAQMDIFTHNRPVVPNNFPGILPPSHGSNMVMRPFGPQGSSEPPLSGSDFNDLDVLHRLSDSNPNTQMGGPNWKRSSPSGPGIHHSPAPGMKPPIRPMSGAWDVFDSNQIQRESKRSRIDGSLPASGSLFPLKKMDHQGMGLDQLYGLAPQDGGALGSFELVQGKNRLSPVDARCKTGGAGLGHPDPDCIWRGLIAKGGTPVCRARCVPVGKGIESEIPEVVNCSARTGLDMLTKHYAEAVGFNVVFFLPDSEDDFASYTEFLRYLGDKDRAGVAKFDDGTTLFLVPPSDFLTKVLKIAGPERLYGVVLKFPQHAPSGTSVQSQPLQSQYIERQQISSRTDFSVVPQKEEIVSHLDYNRVLHEDPMATQNFALPTSNSPPLQPVTSINTAAVSQAGVSLTPELIATLASLIPAKEKSSGLESNQPPSVSSSSRPSLPSNAASDRIILSQGYDHQTSEHTGYPLQQFGNRYNPQSQIPQLHSYPTVSNSLNHSAQGVTGSSLVLDPAFNLPQQAAVSSRPSANYPFPPQSGQFAGSPHVNQQYQFDVPRNTLKGHEMAHGTDASGSYGPSVYQQSTNSFTSSNQGYGANVSRPDTTMPLATEKVNSDLSSQVQQLQSALSGAGQGTSEMDVDKNQRYQSTLQFAANLLLQIQQQQQQQQQQQTQQTNAQAGQGLGNH